MAYTDSEPQKSQIVSILYVDDEPDILAWCKKFLEQTGSFKVDTRTSALDALHSPDLQSYDVIVSGYQMVGMDGIAFLREVRRIHGWVPFILFTGHGSEEVAIQALNGGADFYLRKGGDPISQFKELSRMIGLAVLRRDSGRLLKDGTHSELVNTKVTGLIETGLSSVNIQRESFSRESEEEFRSIVERASDLVLILDNTFRVTYASPSSLSILGYSPEELIGKTADFAACLIFPQSREKFWNVYQITLNGEATGCIEIPCKKKNGKPLIVILSTVPVFKSGILAGAQVSIRDVTESKTCEVALLESEGRFRRFSDNAKDILFRIRVPGRKFEFVSKASLLLTGYTPEEYYADPDLFISLVHPTSRDYYLEQWKNILEKTPPLNFEFQVIDQNGEPRWFNQRTTLVTDHQGELVAVEGIITDISRQKKIEYEFRRSEERLLAATTNEGSWVWEDDPEGIFTYASPAVEVILGYSPEDLVGKVHFSDLIDPRVREVVMRDLADIINSRMSFTHEVITKCHRNGKMVVLKCSGVPVFDDEGIFTGYCGVDTDITAEKEAEDRLIESEAKYRLLADHISDVIWTVNQRMQLTYISPSVQALLGVTQKEAQDVPIHSFLTPESFQNLKEFQEKLKGVKGFGKGFERTNVDLEFRRIDGSTVWTEVRYSPLIDPKTGFNGVVGVARDISERRLAEATLRESEEKFRSFVENANDIVISVNPDGFITYLSPKWAELLGYEIDDSIGKPMSLFIHPEDYDGIYSVFIRVLETGTRNSGNESRIRHKNSSWNWVSQSFSPVFDEDGKVISIQGIIHDITQRRQIQDALIKANRQLSLMTGITRHDILNKLSVIFGQIGVVGMGCTKDELAESLSLMKSSATDIRAQIEFTRVYESLGLLEPQWAMLNSVIPSTSLPDTVTLTRSIGEISILADPMIEKVFFNLLDNSIRHGGHVSKIDISAYEEGDGLTVVVEDNGVGIVPWEKELIFERGYGKNTGLGMFLVREILSLSGISILENGMQGTGARFELHIPKGLYRTGC